MGESKFPGSKHLSHVLLCVCLWVASPREVPQRHKAGDLVGAQSMLKHGMPDSIQNSQCFQVPELPGCFYRLPVSFILQEPAIQTKSFAVAPAPATLQPACPSWRPCLLPPLSVLYRALGTPSQNPVPSEAGLHHSLF